MAEAERRVPALGSMIGYHASMLETIIAVLVGGAITYGTTHWRDRRAEKREDRLREFEAKAKRTELERDAIADLLAGLLPLNSAVGNLGYAYTARAKGAPLDAERVREYQAMMQVFWAPLMRARVAVRNPVARPPLDTLRQWYTKMHSHLSLQALERPSPDFASDFGKFQTVLADASQALEQAALTWDGSLPKQTTKREIASNESHDAKGSGESQPTQRED